MTGVKKVWTWFKECTKNPTFASAFGSILTLVDTFFLGFFVGTYQYHDAVTYNNISSYIDALMVTPGVVEAEILSLDNPFKQIEMIATKLFEDESNSNALRTALQQILISTGEDETAILRLPYFELTTEF